MTGFRLSLEWIAWKTPTMTDFMQAREQVDPRQLKEVIVPVDHATWYCGKCLAYCPVDQENNMMEHSPAKD